MNIWRKLFTTAALAFILCLTGLVMSGEAQAQRFVDNGNGTVTDTVTRLMWTKDANPFGNMNWHDAMARCGSFSVSGIGGWRLPSKDELVALYHAIKGEHLFTRVQSSYYWSSTALADVKNYAWNVHMNYGFSYYDSMNDSKTSSYYVWPVRTGK